MVGMQPDYFPFYRLRFYWVLRVALRPLMLELGKLLSEGLFVEILSLFHGLYDRLEEEVPAFGVVVADEPAPHPVGVVVEHGTAPDGEQRTRLTFVVVLLLFRRAPVASRLDPRS